MSTRTGTLAAAIVVLLAAPSWAQDTAFRDLERSIERLTERLERRFEAGLQGQDQARERARQRREEAQRRREELARQRRERAQQVRDRVRQGPSATEPFSRTVRLGRNGSFQLTNVVGDVIITGGSGDDARIEAVKRVWHQDEAEAKRQLSELQIEVLERPSQLEVRTVLPDSNRQDSRRRRFSASVDYTVAIPSGSSVNVRTVSGDVRVSNVRGELRVESVNGDVVTSSIGQLRSLKSLSGDIQIEDAESTDFTASTTNGDIIARNLKARTIDSTTVSGDVRFTDVESDRANLRTLNGDIEYGGRLARGGRYEFQSHSGDLRVTPAGNAGFDVEAATMSGDVRSDFALTLGDNLLSRGPRGTRSVRGSFGDGGANLLLRSFNGDITIIRR